MLQTNKKILDKAHRGGYAVGAFNTNNMEITQAIVRAAIAEKSPAIISTSEGAIDYAGIEYLASMVKIAAKNASVPISLHLDHGKELKYVRLALKNGYTSVMLDGSHLEFDENIKITRKVVQLAHARGVSVEGELGTIGGAEDKVSARKIVLTEPEDAVEFVKRTGVDQLAIAIGTSHGAYKFTGPSLLDIVRLKAIKKLLNMPLVLHGASVVPRALVMQATKYGATLGKAHGVDEEQLRKAVRNGINKVNVDTDLRLSFTAGVRELLKKKPSVFDPRKILKPATDLMIKTIRGRMRLLRSSGKG